MQLFPHNFRESAMKIKIEYDILPSDWENLVTTFIDGGVGREWVKRVDVQVFHESKKKPMPIGPFGRWKSAPYGKSETYSDAHRWRLVLLTHKELHGDSCFDGVQWGWHEGDKVQARYELGPEEIAWAADKSPQTFATWIESGERNISTKFDALDAEHIMQLACFGVAVYG